jgi:hypothetical protein
MSIEHCIAKIAGIVAEGRDNRRSILQLGYNLGRLGELTGLGREPFWDAWKEPVEAWDLATLQRLVQELHKFDRIRQPAQADPEQISEPGPKFRPDSDVGPKAVLD